MSHIARRALLRAEAPMSIFAAIAQVQPGWQHFLFAAMLVHMICHFSAEDAPAATIERDDVPLWPYAA